MNLSQMVELLKNDLNNERKHMMFYLTNASQFTGIHAHEYKEFFLKSAASEMEHIAEFQDLIAGLNPLNKLSPDWVAPRNVDQLNQIFNLYTDPYLALHYALEMEQEVVNNYIQRQKDAQKLAETDPINGAWIDIFLDSQIQDSRQDADHIKQLLR